MPSAFCIAMHTDEALRDGESLLRLTMLYAWEKSILYSDRERVVLTWAEEVALIAGGGTFRFMTGSPPKAGAPPRASAAPI